VWFLILYTCKEPKNNEEYTIQAAYREEEKSIGLLDSTYVKLE
jgi:hypothetical protein